jgi:bacterioferritin
MKGNSEITIALQTLLEGELSAIDQYFIHARMYDDMGFTKLGERLWHESDEEKTHADIIIKRMLFLEAQPDLSRRDPIKVGSSVPEMLQNDLD